MNFWTRRTTAIGALVVMAVAAALPTMAAQVGGGGSALLWFRDTDADGQGDWYELAWAASQPAGYVKNNTDCDDTNNKVFLGSTLLEERGPGAPEDVDCDGISWEHVAHIYREDRDRDALPGNHAPTPPLTYNEAKLVAKSRNIALIPQVFGTPTDCDDTNPSIHNRFKTCSNPSTSSTDWDGDGQTMIEGGGIDCDDADGGRFVGNTERLDDGGKDNDCDPNTGGAFTYDPNFRDPRKALPAGARAGRQNMPPRPVRVTPTSP